MVAAAGIEIARGVTRVFESAELTLLERMLEAVGRIDGDVSQQAIDADAVRVDQLDRLERLKGAVEAAQSRVIASFERSQVPPTSGLRQGRGEPDASPTHF